MKRLIHIALSLFMLFALLVTECFALELESPYVLLINRNEDAILYEKDSEKEISIASMTKLMTALVAREHITDAQESVTVKWYELEGLIEANASVAGFYAGESVTYEDLLYGLLLPSGADAAQVLAYEIAGGVSEFVQLMNEKAEEMGLTHTHFANTTGLDNPENYSTLREVGMILEEVLKDPLLYEVLSTRVYTTSSGRLTLLSTTEMYLRRLKIDMDYLIGGKTGSTPQAGICFASVAEKDGVGYLCVVAGASYWSDTPYQILDSKELYEYYMEHYSYQDMVSEGELLLSLPTLYCKEKEVSFYADHSVNRYLENSFEKEDVTLKYEGTEVITHKMKAGELLGEVSVIHNGETVDRFPVILAKEQEFDFMDYLAHHKKEAAICVTASLLILTSFLLYRRKRKH